MTNPPRTPPDTVIIQLFSLAGQDLLKLDSDKTIPGPAQFSRWMSKYCRPPPFP